MAKRSRQSSSSTNVKQSNTSELRIGGTGAACNTQKKKDHAHREKKRRGDLNTCYGELMALLMQVDPEVGGSLETTANTSNNDYHQSKKDNDVPEVIPVENLLPRRDLINRAVATIKSLNKENEQLEGFLKEKRKRDLEQILRQREDKNVRKTQTRRLNSGASSNLVQQLINTRKDPHHHVAQQQQQHHQQASIRQNNFLQQVPTNLANKVTEQLQQCLRVGGNGGGFGTSNPYDVASAAAQQMNNLLGSMSQQQQQEKQGKATMTTQQKHHHQQQQCSFQQHNHNNCSIRQLKEHASSSPSSVVARAASLVFPISNNNNNNNCVQQSHMNHDLKQQLNEQALTAYAVFLRDLASSHQN